MEGVVGEVYSMFNATSESLVYHCLLRCRFFQHAELNFVTSASAVFSIKSIAPVTWLPRTLLMYIYLRSERCLV